MQQQEFSEALQLIYDAGLDFARWPQALEKLAEMLGASMTCLVRHDTATGDGAMITVRAEPETSRLYAGHYAKVNLLAQRAGARPAETCMTDRAVLAKEELFRSEFYADFLRPRDVHSILSVFLLQEGATRVAFGRPHRAGDWEPAEIERLSLFAPHLHRAAEMNVRLESFRLSEIGLARTLDYLPRGIIIVDTDNRPLLVNSAADTILREADGLRIEAGRLCAKHLNENAALTRIIAAAARGSLGQQRANSLSISGHSTQRRLSLLVAPLHRHDGWFLPQRPSAIIFIEDARSTALPWAEQSRRGQQINRRQEPMMSRLRAIKRDIMAELDRGDLSINTLAARHRLKPRYIQRLFAQDGTTFSEFVLAQRLYRARQLLTDSRYDDATIAAIGFACGFNDQSYFNRCFRKFFGLTPSDMRARRRGGKASRISPNILSRVSNTRNIPLP